MKTATRKWWPACAAGAALLVELWPAGATAQVIAGPGVWAAPPVVVPAPVPVTPPPAGLAPPPLAAQPPAVDIPPLQTQLLPSPQLSGQVLWDSQRQALGIINQTLVDATRRQLMFLVADVNGQMIVIPYDVVRTVVEKGQPQLILNKSVAQLLRAPRIVDGQWQVVNNPQFVRQVVRFYGGLGLTSQVAVRLGLQPTAEQARLLEHARQQVQSMVQDQFGRTPLNPPQPQPTFRLPAGQAPGPQTQSAQGPRNPSVQPYQALSSGAQPGNTPQNNAQTGQPSTPQQQPRLPAPPSDNGQTPPPDPPTRLR